MDFFEIIQILRRRWIVVVVLVVVGVVAGFLTAPGEGADDDQYAATTTLLANPLYDGRLNLQQAALLATTGDVPRVVADALGADDPDEVRRDVRAAADSETASIELRAQRPDPGEAEDISATFARALTESLGSIDAVEYEREVTAASERVAEVQAQVDALEFQIASEGPDPSLEVALQTAQQELGFALSFLAEVRAQGAPRPPLIVVEEGESSLVEQEGFGAPQGRLQRAGLLGAFGLLVGLGAAFGLDRLDTKVRNKAATASAFGHPVLAEIPPLPRSARNDLVAVTDPSSPFVEAYRALRTLTILSVDELPRRAEGQGMVIVVTSPGAGEGKTTTAAHLAGLLAEVDRSVLVVSADFRRPRVHALLGADREPGLTGFLADEGSVSLRDAVQATTVDGVMVMSSGAPTTNPAPLLRRVGEVLQAGRAAFDFVIVDTAPLLVANDAAELATAADAVLLTAHSSRTTIDAAQRATEILGRIDTPVLGAVLVAATDIPAAYGYYRSRYYADADAKG